NKDMQNFVRDLLHMYRKYPAMYKLDDSWNGFSWVNADDASRSIFSFIRRDGTGKNSLLFVVNMTPVAYDDYMVGAPVKGKYTLVLDQDGEVAPSTDKTRVFTAKKGECDKLPYRISYPLPGYGCAVFRFNEK
ncbi:MAG: alpha amylase C-terminal domain-containing protein, partial [Solobacterium sp.]|nr:alpha amylase C-terminal domain-containing protein [Solobacterium sp.]